MLSQITKNKQCHLTKERLVRQVNNMNWHLLQRYSRQPETKATTVEFIKSLTVCFLKLWLKKKCSDNQLHWTNVLPVWIPQVPEKSLLTPLEVFGLHTWLHPLDRLQTCPKLPKKASFYLYSESQLDPNPPRIHWWTSVFSIPGDEAFNRMQNTPQVAPKVPAV